MEVLDYKENNLWVKSRGDATGDNFTRTRAARFWNSMRGRCRKGGYVYLNQPTYNNCSISDNFKNFQYFAEWCQSQIGYSNGGWHLDKDILKRGNTDYNENYCVFVPREINNLFTKSLKTRGDLPIGVGLHKCGQYVSRCQQGVGESVYLGLFETPNEAFEAYKIAKESYIKTVANKYEGRVDARVYEALMNYEVEITD